MTLGAIVRQGRTDPGIREGVAQKIREDFLRHPFTRGSQTTDNERQIMSDLACCPAAGEEDFKVFLGYADKAAEPVNGDQFRLNPAVDGAG